MVWLEKPRAMCLESAEKAISLGKSLLFNLVICSTFSVWIYTSLSSPFYEKVTIRVPEALTAKLAIYSLG